jgi:hypothetical protein
MDGRHPGVHTDWDRIESGEGVESGPAPACRDEIDERTRDPQLTPYAADTAVEGRQSGQ